MTRAGGHEPARLVITRGGTPSPEEITAVVVALSGIRQPEPDAVSRQAPAWSRAGRLEALGYAPVVSAPDLAGRDRSG